MKVYQVINVNICARMNDIIPDSFVFNNYEDAIKSIEKRIKIFKENGVNCEYKNIISSIVEIKDIIKYTHFNFEEEKTLFYIYELEVK